MSTSAFNGDFSQGRFNATVDSRTFSRQPVDQTFYPNDSDPDEPQRTDSEGSQGPHLPPSSPTPSEKNERAPENEPWFSPDFLDLAWDSLSLACFSAVATKRDEILLNSQSNLAMKVVIYLTTEIAAILLIPVSIIEGIFRFAISSLLYPFAVMNVISTGDESFYETLLGNHVIAFGAVIVGVQATFANLNPNQNLDDEINSIKNHYPVLAKFLQ